MSDLFKKQYALDLAYALSESRDTNVTAAQIDQWRDADLFEWLELQGYAWTGDGWSPVE